MPTPKHGVWPVVVTTAADGSAAADESKAGSSIHQIIVAGGGVVTGFSASRSVEVLAVTLGAGVHADEGGGDGAGKTDPTSNPTNGDGTGIGSKTSSSTSLPLTTASLSAGLFAGVNSDGLGCCRHVLGDVTSGGVEGATFYVLQGVETRGECELRCGEDYNCAAYEHGPNGCEIHAVTPVWATTFIGCTCKKKVVFADSQPPTTFTTTTTTTTTTTITTTTTTTTDAPTTAAMPWNGAAHDNCATISKRSKCKKTTGCKWSASISDGACLTDPEQTPALALESCSEAKTGNACRVMDGCKYSKKKGCSYDCVAHKRDKKSCRAAGSNVCRWKSSNQTCLNRKVAVASGTCDSFTAQAQCNKSTLGCKWNRSKKECAATGHKK